MTTFLQHLLNGIATGSIYALLALGYTMVYGVLKLINFAHSDVFMIGAFSGYYAAHALGFASNPSLPGALAVMVCSMAVCGTLGFLNERIAYRPLRGAPRITSLITAIGVSLLLEYGGQMVFGPDPKFFPQVFPKSNVQLGGVNTTNYQLIVVAVALALMAGLQWIVYRTRFGKAMRAVSHNFEMASLMGIPTDRVISTTFVLGSTLAAAAGCLYGLVYPKIDPLMGVFPGLKAFVAAVLGGIGNVPGAMLGGMVIGLIEEYAVAVDPWAWQTLAVHVGRFKDAIVFGILVAILIFRPSGLLGRYEPEKV